MKIRKNIAGKRGPQKSLDMFFESLSISSMSKLKGGGDDGWPDVYWPPLPGDDGQNGG